MKRRLRHSRPPRGLLPRLHQRADAALRLLRQGCSRARRCSWGCCQEEAERKVCTRLLRRMPQPSVPQLGRKLPWKLQLREKAANKAAEEKAIAGVSPDKRPMPEKLHQKKREAAREAAAERAAAKKAAAEKCQRKPPHARLLRR